MRSPHTGLCRLRASSPRGAPGVARSRCVHLHPFIRSSPIGSPRSLSADACFGHETTDVVPGRVRRSRVASDRSDVRRQRERVGEGTAGAEARPSRSSTAAGRRPSEGCLGRTPPPSCRSACSASGGVGERVAAPDRARQPGRVRARLLPTGTAERRRRVSSRRRRGWTRSTRRPDDPCAG